MPVHIESLTSEIVASGADLPMTPAQIERLVELVAARVEERMRRSADTERMTAVRRGALDDGAGGR